MAELDEDEMEDVAAGQLGGGGEDDFEEASFAGEESSLVESTQPALETAGGRGHNVFDDPADLPPAYLKDISSLASWTASTSKPGYGLNALRHPSPTYYWQSDGPQPHTINVHFFKLVSIAHIRIFLDIKSDESYTPKKMQWWAGTGHHDLQLLTEMDVEAPRGWQDVDLSWAGGPKAFQDGEVSEDEETADEDEGDDAEARKRRRLMGRGPTLRCFLLQLRIMENYQNGKDTHLRGLQIFARDDSVLKRKVLPSVSVTAQPIAESGNRSASKSKKVTRKKKQSLGAPTETVLGMRFQEWMGEPELR